MPTSQSLQTVPSRPSETRSTSNRPSAARRVFDTVENLFFKEGDELSKIVPVDHDFDEVTELVEHPKGGRKLALLIATGVVALITLGVLVF